MPPVMSLARRAWRRHRWSRAGRAARHAMGLDTTSAPAMIPNGIYSIPEMASLGFSEAEARAEHGDNIVVGRAEFAEIARGQIAGSQLGLLKLITDADGFVIGVHVVGDGATELVHLGQMAMVSRAHVSLFVEHVFNFPTLAESYRVAALSITAQLAAQATAPAEVSALVDPLAVGDAAVVQGRKWHHPEPRRRRRPNRRPLWRVRRRWPGRLASLVVACRRRSDSAGRQRFYARRPSVHVVRMRARLRRRARPCSSSSSLSERWCGGVWETLRSRATYANTSSCISIVTGTTGSDRSAAFAITASEQAQALAIAISHAARRCPRPRGVRARGCISEWAMHL